MPYSLELPNCPGAPARLRLEGEVTVDNAGELKQTLLQALQEGPTIVVDCAAATAIDLAALQLLCAAHRSAVTLGKVMALENEEGLVARSVEEAGFRRQCSCLLSPEKTNCLWLSRRCG